MNRKQRLTYWLVMFSFAAVVVTALVGCATPPDKPAHMMTCAELREYRAAEHQYWCGGAADDIYATL